MILKLSNQKKEKNKEAKQEKIKTFRDNKDKSQRPFVGAICNFRQI